VAFHIPPAPETKPSDAPSGSGWSPTEPVTASRHASASARWARRAVLSFNSILGGEPRPDAIVFRLAGLAGSGRLPGCLE